MVGYRIDYSRAQQLNANSEVYSGAKLYVYQNNTTTLVDVFSDRDALAAAANPIVADSSGRLPVRYVDSDDMLTLVLKTSADVEIWSDDDQEPVPNITNADLANYLPLAGGTMTGPIRFAEGAAVASAATVNLDAATGNFLHVTGTIGITAITLAQGAMRWVVFDGALTLTHSANLLIGGANITTHANMVLQFIGEGGGVVRLIGGMTASGRAVVESIAVQVGIGDETTAIAAGAAKRTIRAPVAMSITGARASLVTAQTSGDLVTVDVNIAGVSIFSTVITIDNNETTSTSALTACVLTSSAVSVADDAVITFDIDDCDGATTAAGLKVTLLGYKIGTA